MDHTLALPLHEHLNDEDVETIAGALERVLDASAALSAGATQSTRL
jgi:dTDP-4-amino-4,6-dideoxygalactose transaminase